MDTIIYTPFLAKRDNGQRIIEGPINADMVDLDGQRVDPEWLKRALPGWMAYGNIREQHNPRRPVGKALSLNLDHPVGPSIVAKIADDECWRKIEDGVFSGFSIGVANARIVKDGTAPHGRVIGGEVIEVSVVDHPSVRKAAFTLVSKLADGWHDGQTGAVIEPELHKYISTKERDHLKDEDFAGPHRSFPIADQDDVDAAEHLIGHADDPEAVKARIHAICKRKGLAYPAAWKGSASVSKAAKDVPMNEHDEDLDEDLLHRNRDRDRDRDDKDRDDKDRDRSRSRDHDADARDDREHVEKAPDRRDHDDYTCPKCGEDARWCDCYAPETTKAAADFEAQNREARPLRAGHPDIKGRATTVHAYGAQHEGPEGQHGGLDNSDAVVRLDYLKQQVEHLVSRMESALDGLNKAGFNPNEPTERTRSMPKSDPNANPDMGATPDQKWHGHTATTENMVHKGMEQAEIRKIAADTATNAAHLALDAFFTDNEDILTKGATPDSTKASFVGLVRTIASAVTDEAFDQLEARVAKVEKMPMPSKGFAGSPASRLSELNTTERQLTETDITRSLASMSDDDRLALTAQAISYDWSRAQGRR